MYYLYMEFKCGNINIKKSKSNVILPILLSISIIIQPGMSKYYVLILK